MKTQIFSTFLLKKKLKLFLYKKCKIKRYLENQKTIESLTLQNHYPITSTKTLFY